MNYSPNMKPRELEIPAFDGKKAVANTQPKKKKLKSKKIKTAKVIMKFFAFGVCVGFIPTAIVKGNEMPELYAIPLIPVVIYLIYKVVSDLKGWYENEEM